MREYHMKFLKNKKYFLTTTKTFAIIIFVVKTWPVGQEVKTSPSHGENTGSIPVQAVRKPSIYAVFRTFKNIR